MAYAMRPSLSTLGRSRLSGGLTQKAVRQDHRSGVGRRGFGRWSADYSALVLEGTGRNTQSGRERKVPLTARLKAALKAHRHLKSELVFCHGDGKPFTQSASEAALRFACKRSGLRPIGSHEPGTPSVRTSPCEALRRRRFRSGRTLDAEHDPSVHASSAERASRSDRLARLWATRGQRRSAHWLK